MTTAIIESTEQKALSIPDQAKSLTVTNNDEYLQGESLLLSCKQLETEIHEAFDPIVDKAHKAHKEAVAQRTKYLTPIEEGRKILKSKMINFQDEQEKIRREEQRLLEEEARKRAEEEALALAVEAEQTGDKELAAAILEQPVDVAPIMAQKVAPAASRLSAGRSVWSGEVVNLMALVKAVASGQQPLAYLEASKTALSVAAKLKTSCNIPGLKATERRV